MLNKSENNEISSKEVQALIKKEDINDRQRMQELLELLDNSKLAALNMQEFFESMPSPKEQHIIDGISEQTGDNEKASDLPVSKREDRKNEKDDLGVLKKEMDLENKYGQLIFGFIKSQAIKNELEEVFYKNLWDILQNKLFIEKKEERYYALLCIWRNPLIPYFHLNDGMKMENDVFKKRSNELKRKIEKATYILQMNFEQRTERASLIIELLDDCDREDKAVLMSHIFKILEIEATNRLLQGIARHR